MGFFGSVVGFALGYAAGMKVGDRPVQAVRRAATDARASAASAAAAAGRLRSKIGGVGERAIDVRQVREVMTAAPETVTLDEGKLA